MEKAFSFEIDNIRERSEVIKSDPFSYGGCEWFVQVYPYKYPGQKSLGLHLSVWDPESLSLGWRRSVRFYFAGLYQSGKQLFEFKANKPQKVASYQSGQLMWGYITHVGLPMLQNLENNKLILEVYIHLLEVVPPVMIDFNGFQILSTQAFSVGKIYAEHPDFAVGIKPNNQGVKTAYMNLLLGLIDTLSKSPQSLFVIELTNAQRELTDLTEAGFKLDWLNSKLEAIFSDRKKALDDGSWVEHLEERVKTLELALSDLKAEQDKASDATARPSSFEIIDFLIKKFFLSCFSISKC